MADWAGKRQEGRLCFHPDCCSVPFLDKHREHSNIGGRFKKKNTHTEEEPGEQTKGTRVLRPGSHLVLGFLFFFFCI